MKEKDYGVFFSNKKKEKDIEKKQMQRRERA
jgi:hypothetical protein